MSSNKLYIVIKGGLGNQLFQIATGLFYSEKTNRELIINVNLIHQNTHQSYDKTITKLKELIPTIKFTYEIINTKNMNNLFIYNEPNNKAFTYINLIDLINQETNKNIILNGYFQNEKYINDKFKQIIINPTDKKLLQQDFTDYYFLHIRLGDYINNKFHFIDLIDYYNYIINKVTIEDNKAKFIICTNQYDNILKDILNKIKLNNVNYEIQDKTNDEFDTLYIMKSCKGAICSNSSLSWMGSYLQNNKSNIYMPYPWVNMINGFYHDDIICVYPEYAHIYDTEKKVFIK
jgi:hypothetical protein